MSEKLDSRIYDAMVEHNITTSELSPSWLSDLLVETSDKDVRRSLVECQEIIRKKEMNENR